MFDPTAYENSRPGGIAVLEIPERLEADQPRRFVPLKVTEVGGEVMGPLAALTITHVYGYTKEQCNQVLEAVYRFPLPGDAAITRVTVCFGDVEIRAELEERHKAEADYAEARRQGRQAALVTRESPDVFTLQVTGLQPDQDVVIETSYVQLAQPEGVGWTLRIPLTTSPRYTRSDERTSPHARGQPLLLMRDPGHRFSLDLLLPGAGTVASPTHDLEVSDEDGRTRVRLRDGVVIPDRDCVLLWRMAQHQDRPALHVLTHADAGSGEVYFLGMVAPPPSTDPNKAVPREVILLVDHSGSMEGPKWAAADWAVKKFLSDLGEQDTFALGVFHDTTRWFADRPQQATARVVEHARRFVDGARDSGGTELGVALEQALHLSRTRGELARHVLLITDAEVSDAGRILRLAGEESRREDRRRISVLCVDAAPNSFLARELARRGGGLARFLTSDPAEGDVTTALDEVLLDWSQPVLTGLRLEVDCPHVEASGREVIPAAERGWSAVDLGDLPAGRTVWACGRVARGESRQLRFRLAGRQGEEVAGYSIDPGDDGLPRPSLKALFGAWRVLGLEFLLTSGYTGEELATQLARLGYDPETELARAPDGKRLVYAENVRNEVRRALDHLLLRESLNYGLLSSATGFVAVRSEAGKVVDATVPVASALPAGWSEQFLSVAAAPAVAYTVAFEAEDMTRPPQPSPRAASSPISRFASVLGRLGAAPAGGRRESARAAFTVFKGKPSFQAGKAVLLDTSAQAGSFSLLRLRFPDGAPDPKALDPGLALLVYVGDLSSPVVRVRLVDLVRQGGERPVNLSVQSGERLMIVLADSAGAWASAPPRIEVTLE